MLLNLKINLFQYKGKPVFEDSISLLVYPIETIFAEKLETVISKGAGNSRVKDYHDLFLLSRNKELRKSKKLNEAVENTFSNRGTTLHFLKFDNSDLKVLQQLWVGHLHALGHVAQTLNLPEEIGLIISEINDIMNERGLAF